MPNSCEVVFPIQVLSHSIGMKVRDSSSNCKSRTNDLVMVFVNDVVVVVYGPHSRLIFMKYVQCMPCSTSLKPIFQMLANTTRESDLIQKG